MAEVRYAEPLDVLDYVPAKGAVVLWWCGVGGYALLLNAEEVAEAEVDCGVGHPVNAHCGPVR